MTENKKYNWLNTISLTVTFILACTLVPWYGLKYGFTGFEWIIFGFFMVFTGTGITVGYHRLWSHKTYEANAVFQSWFAFWGAVAAQNTIIEWSRDHRDHHKYVDNNEKKTLIQLIKVFGFHTFFGFFKILEQTKNYNNVKDLKANKICLFQEKILHAIINFWEFCIACFNWLHWSYFKSSPQWIDP